MASELELLSALAHGLRAVGVPNPERCTLRTRWSGLDLVAQVHWPDFAVPVKTGTPLIPYTDHVFAAGALATGPTILQWMTETVPTDGLALLWAEFERIRTRYPHKASMLTWPQGWPLPDVRNLTVAGTHLPYSGQN